MNEVVDVSISAAEQELHVPPNWASITCPARVQIVGPTMVGRH